MITYFPKPYPDELLYSLFARYYAKTGYLAYIYAAEDLYVNRNTRPDAEFLNELTDEVKNILTRSVSMEDLIQMHTMFPYYGRFLKYERRQKAFDALASTKGNYHYLLAIPNRGIGLLRYCPMCAAEDRNKYGETYWHRMHQMQGVDICPEHLCKLVNSNVTTRSRQSPNLITAEEVDLTNEILLSVNIIEEKTARYVLSVFQAPVNMDCKTPIGNFLHSRMANTKYLSVRGERRNMSLIYSEFSEYYKGLTNNPVKEPDYLKKIFTSQRPNTYDICLIAMFLDIPACDLVNMKLPQKTQHQLFDKRIIQLHNKGLKYTEIAKQLNASYDIVKAIGEGRY